MSDEKTKSNQSLIVTRANTPNLDHELDWLNVIAANRIGVVPRFIMSSSQNALRLPDQSELSKFGTVVHATLKQFRD